MGLMEENNTHICQTISDSQCIIPQSRRTFKLKLSFQSPENLYVEVFQSLYKKNRGVMDTNIVKAIIGGLGSTKALNSLNILLVNK